MHMNSAVESKENGSIIISARNQSAIIKLSYPEGKIKRILASRNQWGPKYLGYLLTHLGKEFEWSIGQYSQIILPDQDRDPGTVDILLFDNHTFPNVEISPETVVLPETRYSRFVQYRINEKTRTVEQVWEFGKEYEQELFAQGCGSVQYLANGNVLGYFELALGHPICYGRIIEVQKVTKKVVFDASIYLNDRENFEDYRAIKRKVYSASDNFLYKLEPLKENNIQN